jgi:hypothetical protein
MAIKEAVSCPMGSVCEEIKGDTLYRCAWSVKIAGKNPNTGEELSEWKCSMAWLPILLIENTSKQIGTAAAVESFRNAVIEENLKTTARTLLANLAIGHDK